MRTKTTSFIALLLFCTAFLFHFSAKRQPTEEEKQQFDFLRQPRSWQGKPAPEPSLDLLNGEKFALSEHVGKKAIVCISRSSTGTTAGSASRQMQVVRGVLK